MSATDGLKRCPDCAELVQAEARICRFCRYNFDTGERMSPEARVATAATPTPSPSLDATPSPASPSMQPEAPQASVPEDGQTAQAGPKRRSRWVTALAIVGAVGISLWVLSAVTGTQTSSDSTGSSLGELLEDVDDSLGLPSGQSNAVSQAESYLNTSAFSRKGLIEQLQYEGYSLADATYAVDNVTVDWNEQAALKAQSYLNTSSFSRSGLLEQLSYEGFTRSQAEYGVNVAY